MAIKTTELLRSRHRPPDPPFWFVHRGQRCVVSGVL